MTKKQEKIFTQIFSGSLLLHSDFGLDDCENITQENFVAIEKLKTERACKLLGKYPAFASTKEIINYVRTNF